MDTLPEFILKDILNIMLTLEFNKPVYNTHWGLLENVMKNLDHNLQVGLTCKRFYKELCELQLVLLQESYQDFYDKSMTEKDLKEIREKGLVAITKEANYLSSIMWTKDEGCG